MPHPSDVLVIVSFTVSVIFLDKGYSLSIILTTSSKASYSSAPLTSILQKQVIVAFFAILGYGLLYLFGFFLPNIFIDLTL